MDALSEDSDTKMVRKIIKTNIGGLLLTSAMKSVPQNRFFVTQINEK